MKFTATRSLGLVSLLLGLGLSQAGCKSVGSQSALRDISANTFYWRQVAITAPQDNALRKLIMVDDNNFLGFFEWFDPNSTVSEIRLYHSTDGGSSWGTAPVSTLKKTEPPEIVTFAQDGTLSFIATESFLQRDPRANSALPYLLVSVDKGATWKKIVLPDAKAASGGANSGAQPFNQAKFASANLGIITNDSIFRVTTDSGVTWVEPASINSPANSSVRPNGFGTFPGGAYMNFQESSSNTAYKTLVTADDGKTWQLKTMVSPNGNSFNPNNLTFINATTVLYQDFSTGIMRSDDGGATWSVSLPSSRNLGGNRNDLSKSSVTVRSNGSMNQYAFKDAQLGIAAGDNGYVQVTKDGGVSWNANPLDSLASIDAIEMSGTYVLLRTQDNNTGDAAYYVSTTTQPTSKTTAKFTPLPVPTIKTSDGKDLVIADFVPWSTMQAGINLQNPGDIDYGANGDAVTVPDDKRKHLPALTILNALDEIRLSYHNEVPAGAPHLSAYGPKVDSGTVESCLGNTAEHWSDLVLHYYCQLGEARSCYTGQNRAYAEGLQNWLAQWQQKNPGTPADFLFAVSEGYVQPKAIRQTSFNNCKADMYFQWLFDAPNRADVFRAIMFSQVMEYSSEEQQAVLNAYYGRMKPAADGPFNPMDPADCTKYRPRRNFDPQDGTHCRPDCLAGELPTAGRCKVRPTPLRGVGR